MFFLAFNFSSIRSLSPGGRSQRSHRPRLPSIDNDDWGEGNDHHGKSRSRGQATRRPNPSKRPPRAEKVVAKAKNYGSTYEPERVQERGRQKLNKHDTQLDITTKIRNFGIDNHVSDSESESDGSCISSDFTR